ncbi:S53 family peptidase [Lactiplantibacillus mudanjiangensis]|uniref:Pseudomonalisin [Lactobacillus parabuchneri] n=1 Tax=Lactiplantibacillus mudanjiangensis TaxID=1296538 RepID=A0A660E988_9LACO|nr:S53 family peptidase [Lactiplantibacillus mudanjiangensis]VDG18263.1 Pseudomonalisin precursor [Lactobacillus parabuchneri] [Lactiplantibacillus mudanjiangensis]VDG25764.1 Pseudomonalisin precursor [Lactobacillus parabuchneri] [Lactiplantibacillus mudanjiangensis]VDG29639.1 Pseudomonalisin precursor [Lactobacillus parabuchneri] [Lactiplantibacillus mudanjiangensis]VDG33692.1 Pseudomonalisin precursor [Lactobacillus parabuchneri] [Lactiplantibacillus mudanjiangensis]
MKKEWIAALTIAVGVSGGLMVAPSINGQAATATLSDKIAPRVKATSNKKAVSKSKTEVIDIVLKSRNSTALSKYSYATVNPKSASYHQYLTPSAFGQKYGQTTQTLTTIKSYLKKHHLSYKVYGGNLVIRASGKVSNINKAFGVTLVKVKVKGKTYQTHTKKAKLPSSFKGKISAVLGLSSYGKYKSNLTTTAHATKGQLNTGQSTKPQKFAKAYQLDKLYEKGLTGKGQRIAILSFANFHPADAAYYWQKEGIPASQSNITRYNIDGGASWTGYNETTLDVEQAGSVAPDAALDVYLAPQTDTGMINALATIIAKNNAAQLTTSWGQSEGALLSAISQGAETSAYAKAFNALFQQAAVQGISTFAATGDNGAYDSILDNAGSYRTDKTVDFPADSAYVTALGGTTLPFSASYTLNGSKVKVNVKNERAWGSDYLYNRFDKSYYSNYQDRIDDYFAGGGGGFSRLNKTTPAFQRALIGQGVNTFAAVNLWQLSNETLTRTSKTTTTTGTGTGRNVPDLAFNADPNTGYDLYMSSAKKVGKSPKWYTSGGTSVVSPQVAAANAVMNSGLTTRIGYWNPQIYRLAQTKTSPFTPLTSKTDNTNLYYTGQPGKLYNQATGLGTANFETLFEQLK